LRPSDPNNTRWFFVAASDEHFFSEVGAIVERTLDYCIVETRRSLTRRVASQRLPHRDRPCR
jgi:hypothetical protein